MPRTISDEKIGLIEPIVHRINAELKKEQDARKGFHITCATPAVVSSLKTLLETYKTIFAQEWKGKFRMTKRHDNLVFDFTGTTIAPNFTIIEPPQSDDPKTTLAFNINDTAVTNIQHPNDPLMVDLNDNKAAHFILMEQPTVIVLNRMFLTNETISYLTAPNAHPTTALANVLARNGYKWEILIDRVRVFR